MGETVTAWVTREKHVYRWLLAEARWWAEEYVAAMFPVTGLNGLPWKSPDGSPAPP